MAPNKRTRTVDDDEETLRVESAHSSLRQEGRKKARTSFPSGSKPRHEHSSRDSSPSESEREPGPKAIETLLPPSTQYEIDRDGDYSHLEYEELDDERATQRLLARRGLIGENHAAENGIIEFVRVTNFMCHDNLEVQLGPLINFIVGHNGSGKSAVLTAIQLCLGGKASGTNRGGKLGSFIKSGKDQANLTVILKNEGVDSYQHDTFGNRIIIERHFSTSGTSGYKLKSETGRIISTKKSDVEEVIEYYQMQVDNPMNVLTQDEARRFITASSATQKYKFFVKGVQLEQLDNDYQMVQETSDAMEAKLHTGQENLDALKRAKDAAQEKAKIIGRHQSMRDAFEAYAKQVAWAQVEQEEADLSVLEAAATDAEREAADSQARVELKDRAFQGTHDRGLQLKDNLEELNQALVALREEENEAKIAYDIANQEVQNTHHEQRQIKEHLTAAQKNIAAYQKDIAAEQRRIENLHGGAHARARDEHSKACETVAVAKNAFNACEAEVPRLRDRQTAASEELKAILGPIEAKKREKANCEAQIQALARETGNIMAGFHRNMPRLLNMIRDDQGFDEKPVGPIGLHIKLLKPIWSGILEKSIGNMLSGFIVTSKSDQQRLSALVSKLDIGRVDIIIGNHQPLDTHGHEPDEQYDTVLRVLEIDNDLVRRQLIINQGIEQTILIERRTDGERIMYDGPRPRNVKQCFCLNESKRNWGHRLGYMSLSNNATMTPIEAVYGKPRMKTDADSQVTYQKETLVQLRGECSELEARQRELQQALQRRTQAITSHKREVEQKRIQYQRAKDEAERMQDELERDNVEDGKLEGLKVCLRETEEEVKIHGNSYGDTALVKEKQNLVASSRKNALDAIKVQTADHDSKIRKAEKKCKEHESARSIALRAKEDAIEAAEKMEAAVVKAKQKAQKQKDRVNDWTRQATEHCPRVSIKAGDTVASLEAKLEKVRQKLLLYTAKLGGSEEEITAAAEVATEKYRLAREQYQDLIDLLNLLKQTYAKRLDMWRKFQRHISARSRIGFTYLLSERGFRGKLMIDHKSKLLDLKVEPDETTKSSKGRQAKTLSGGEKSFSNICLLLALWEAMGAPLRCLDEFDVFMDQVNRDISTTMIIGAARRSVGKQFILITPNAIGANVDRDEDVRTILLFDPRQKQIDTTMAGIGAVAEDSD